MFTPQQREQLLAHGISLEKAEEQMKAFQTGFPELNISAACVIGQGIMKPTDAEQTQYLEAWQQYLQGNHTILKFVPASGAASRMFKNLFEYLETGQETPFIEVFLAHKDYFAFGEELQDKTGQEAVRYLLEDMHYGTLPKGLLLFHKYDDERRTPALEHLVEGAMYAKNQMGDVNIHFTVSHEHRTLFEEHIAQHKAEYEQRYDCHINVTFSEQKPSTDTIAADAKNEPFIDKNANLVLRPGGHGALIENLAEQQADIVFIKNIDNVVPDRLKEPTVRYKKLLAGILVTLQHKIFEYLQQLEDTCSRDTCECVSDIGMNDSLRDEIVVFLKDNFCITLSEDKPSRELLQTILNRPLRVCGMVKNEGEPGGGPFLVKSTITRPLTPSLENGGGEITQCQILESSQIADPSLMQQATHFNPVDLVCALKDYKGQPFRLQDFVDPKTGFISEKSKDGKALKALELPGLWNGAMANWNTVFVEVPIETFNPVKTVNDLLRAQHQNNVN